ncbi:MAG: dethiobiotin synthase [Acidimicrobiia bacterium]
MNRPRTLVLVTGTGTEVGKTWWGGAVLAELVRRGVTVSARKPVQSGAGSPSDADVLAAATGEASADVCRRSYEPALAPPIAARVTDASPFTIAELADIDWPPAVDVGWIESAGGVCSPLADDGDTTTLAAAIAPDVVALVAGAGLGTINAVRLSVAALGRGPVVVALNRFDAANLTHRTNLAWLRERDGLDVVTDPAALADRLEGAAARGR